MKYKRAFTLIELLVVVTILALLASLLLPALARAKREGQAGQCLSNKSQIQLAWLLYAQDNGDVLADNHDYHDSGPGYGPFSPPIPPGTPAWCEGWLDWFAPPIHSPPDQNTNTDLLIGKHALLGPYLGHQPASFRCPADVYLSAPQRADGWLYRDRSIAMNGNVGGGAKLVFQGWMLTNPITKLGNFTAPDPAKSWVFMDEHPDWIDDSILYINPAETNGVGEFTELPGIFHNNACGISFADGHAEIHDWVDSRLNLPVIYEYQQGKGPAGITFPAGNPCHDLAWLAQRTPCQQAR